MLHENWSEYDAKEIEQAKNEKCIKCKYRVMLGGNACKGYFICDYMNITGKRRVVRPEDCEKWKD